MEVDMSLYDASVHDRYRALVVGQPLADRLVRACRMDESGAFHAEVSVLVRGRGTSYRGDVLVCSASQPVDPLRPSSVTCGLVELFCVKPVVSLTREEWALTGMREGDRPSSGYAWMLRNPRRVVEMPVKGRQGFYDMAVPKGDITEYPRYVRLGAEGYKMVMR